MLGLLIFTQRSRAHGRLVRAIAWTSMIAASDRSRHGLAACVASVAAYPRAMPKWDGLKPLPDHVRAPLLRALACIPHTAGQRLLLVK